MKVVHIATTTSGGAGIAARRLNLSLNQAGFNSILLSGSVDKEIVMPHESLLKRRTIKKILSKVLTVTQSILIRKTKHLMTTFSLNSINLNEILKHNPDIIHFHSFYNLLNSSSIQKLSTKGIPIFITLHDERFFTGGCHHSFACTGYQLNCEGCPFTRKIFQGYPPREISKMGESFKNYSKIVVIAPSIWILSKARSSKIFENVPAFHIPNCIDFNYSSDLKFEKERKDFYIISFVAQKIFNSYKGVESLLSCIEKYGNQFENAKIRFRFIGDGPNIDIGNLKYEQKSKISEYEMKRIYQDTDLLIVPSSGDNSPNIIFEALSCGVPFICSDRGGLPELAELFQMEYFEFGNPDSMFEAIMKQKGKLVSSSKLRQTVLSMTHPAVVASKHVELYKSKLT